MVVKLRRLFVQILLNHLRTLFELGAATKGPQWARISNNTESDGYINAVSLVGTCSLL